MTGPFKKVKLEDLRINVKVNHEVQYWSRKWGISSLQLESAVKAAGSNVVKHVEEYLRQQGKLVEL